MNNSRDKSMGRLMAAGLAIGTLGVAVSTSVAGDLDNRWYIAPAVSYVKPDDDRKADNGWGGQLGIGKPISESWNIEGNIVGDNLDIKNSTSQFRQRGLGIDALYFFNRDSAFAPYALIGAGALRTKVPGEKNTNAMGNVGLGFMSMFGDALGVRADVRYRLDKDDSSVSGQNRFGDWLVNLGLHIPLGAKAVAAAPVVAAPSKPADSDGDGVTDDKDRCPGTPAGAKVNADGCELDSDGDGVVDSKDRCPNTPAGAKVNADGCELDSDGDGVVDSKDRCPNTPAGAKVNADGCELDSDGDGVVDSLDRCPNTKAGVKVDDKGCEIPAVIVLKGVNFATNSAKLTQGSLAILDEAASTLVKNSDITAEVAGHTDNRGVPAKNKKLSQQRAEAVMNYLVSKGVDASRLTAKGYGQENPMADNGTEDGRAQNRRVELRIMK
ncbi:MAG: OmpA family protein [Pseudomonadota bacterium]